MGKGRPRVDIIDRRGEIERWICQQRSKAFICRELHCKPETLEAYLVKLDLHYQGNRGRRGGLRPKRLVQEYLVFGSLIRTHSLKLLLLRDDVKEHQCEGCLLFIWQGRPIPLEL